MIETTQTTVTADEATARLGGAADALAAAVFEVAAGRRAGPASRRLRRAAAAVLMLGEGVDRFAARRRKRRRFRRAAERAVRRLAREVVAGEEGGKLDLETALRLLELAAAVDVELAAA
jgi:hypothetical protein